MTNLETTITQITSSDVQFLTENECREIMGVLAMRHDRISDRELAILEACEDRVYDLEFGDIDMSYEDNYTNAEADAFLHGTNEAIEWLSYTVINRQDGSIE